ncbi:MAG: type II toxin-antitoxin system HipA family toxin [Leptothrix sp. (in: b-proteobacteria)]
MASDPALIEIYRNGTWEPAAELQPLGDERCRLEYLAEYIFQAGPEPIALGLPVQFNPDIPGDDGLVDRSVPSFLYDLVPQGKGRRFLLDLIQRSDADTLVLPLLMAGAFNPIGRLRLSSAVEFFKTQAARHPEAHQAGGLALEDIRQRSDDYLDHLSLYAMLATGTTGVQGVAPKYLMAQDRQGRWFADLALPDDQAVAHWLMKLPRGKSDADRAVLRNEAAYLRLAGQCGLRAPRGERGLENGVMLIDEILFVRRFDRRVIDGQLHRLHQESLASVAGLRGFAPGTTLNALLQVLRAHATHPAAETVEFVKRDVLNRAMRNTDNHARNTAMQRLPDGTIQLTPVFDFAPMFMDPEGIPRSVEWKDARGVIQRDWTDILRELVESGALPAAEHAALVAELKAFSTVVANLPALATACGVEPAVLDQCLASIEAQAGQLAGLTV